MKLPSRLIDGYHAFVDNRLPLERSRYRKLAETGQRPEVMVICCCDSRVSPEVIFDAHPGELFVVRNVANLIPRYTPGGVVHGASAALEFGIDILKVGTVIVMGHSHCGGIRAYVEHRSRLDPGDFIDNWMSGIHPVEQSVGAIGERTAAEYLTLFEKASAVTTLDNLMSFPFIRRRVESGELELLAAYFEVGTGALSFYQADEGRFVPVENARVTEYAAAAK
jgi:carbonic anhydrase